MGTSRNISLASVLLLVVAVWSCSSIVSSASSSISSFYWLKVHVYIHNGLGPNNTLTIHCKSKDDDLGKHNIAYNQYYEWSFRYDFFERTLFWCNMWWYDHHKLVSGSYVVYRADKDIDRCAKHCNRRAQWGGIYSQNKTGSWLKVYDWQHRQK